MLPYDMDDGLSEGKIYFVPNVTKKVGIHGQEPADIATIAQTVAQRWIWRNDMKIKEVNDEKILFDNGNTITFDHEQDWCEYNYAQFDALEELAFEVEFDEDLTFEAVDGSGFRFGNLPQKMFFIPCYSSQNGYYSDYIDIYYNGENVTGLTCQEDYY